MIELDSENTPERALLIGFEHPETPPGEAEALLRELESLAANMGFLVAGTEMVKLAQPQSRYYVGSGKAEEIAEIADELEADYLLFDDNLSPSQQRNWEKLTGRCVIDRQEVILEIFAARAATREAVLQVALARQEYSLPRLTRAWTHLSRQRGGAKGTRGEGETQLEADRRTASKKISRIKKELEKVRLQRNTMRKQRESRPIPLAGLVGYTNAGKSSLLNCLSGAGVLAEDRLFATLDPTTRRVSLPQGQELLLTDTVGFVRKLPHGLVEAFRSTLDETRYSDFLIHVIDVSSPEAEAQASAVLSVLAEIGVQEKPILTVFNKSDLVNFDEIPSKLKERFPEAVLFSSLTGLGMEELTAALDGFIRESRASGVWLIPPDRFDLAAYMHRSGRVLEESYIPEGILIKAVLPPEAASRLKTFKENTPI